MLKTLELELILKGSGKTNDEAVSKAIGSIQKEIFNHVNALVIRAEPESFEVVEAVYSEKKERFLFIFMPRIRQQYTITLKAMIKAKVIYPNEINWQGK